MDVCAREPICARFVPERGEAVRYFKTCKPMKDVTKIKNITEAITDSYGKNQKSGYLRDVSMGNRAASDEKSSGQENENVPDIRFSLAQYSEVDRHDIVAIIRPHVGTAVDKNPEDYAKYLAGKGVNIPVKDAWEFALEASRRNMADARKRAAKRRGDSETPEKPSPAIARHTANP